MVMVVPWRTCVTVVEPVIGGEDEVEGEFGEVGGVVGELVGELVGVLVGAVVGCVVGEVVSPSEHEDPNRVAVAWVTVTGMVVTTGTCTVLTDPSIKQVQHIFASGEGKTYLRWSTHCL